MRVLKKMTLEDYLQLKYPVTLYEEEGGGYTVKIRDLPGCVSQGEALEEAISMIADARESWLRTAFDHGDFIPLPNSAPERGKAARVTLIKIQTPDGQLELPVQKCMSAKCQTLVLRLPQVMFCSECSKRVEDAVERESK